MIQRHTPPETLTGLRTFKLNVQILHSDEYELLREGEGSLSGLVGWFPQLLCIYIFP